MLWSSHSTFLHPCFFVCETGISRSLVSREPLKVLGNTLKHLRNLKTLTFWAMNCVHITVNKSFAFMILCRLVLLWNQYLYTVNFPSYQFMYFSFSSKPVIMHDVLCMSLFPFIFVDIFSYRSRYFLVLGKDYFYCAIFDYLNCFSLYFL